MRFKRFRRFSSKRFSEPPNRQPRTGSKQKPEVQRKTGGFRFGYEPPKVRAAMKMAPPKAPPCCLPCGKDFLWFGMISGAMFRTAHQTYPYPPPSIKRLSPFYFWRPGCGYGYLFCSLRVALGISEAQGLITRYARYE